MSQSLPTPYFDNLCSAREYEGLCHISATLCGSDQFKHDEPDYGLPAPVFCFVERLIWFAQGIRSGAWTYFEATPPERQQAMLSALNDDKANPDFVVHYASAIKSWRMPSAMAIHDAWLDKNDDLNNAIMWQIICDNRTLIQELTGW